LQAEAVSLLDGIERSDSRAAFDYRFLGGRGNRGQRVVFNLPLAPSFLCDHSVRFLAGGGDALVATRST
jgi:hypothetical protein